MDERRVLFCNVTSVFPDASPHQNKGGAGVRYGHGNNTRGVSDRDTNYGTNTELYWPALAGE